VGVNEKLTWEPASNVTKDMVANYNEEVARNALPMQEAGPESKRRRNDFENIPVMSQGYVTLCPCIFSIRA